MGLHDRPYMQDQPPAGPHLGGLTIGMPRPAKAVKYMLLINIVVFVVQMFLDQPQRNAAGIPVRAGPMSLWLGMTVAGFWQVWRYVTMQFLHAGFWHIALNMLGLYILGTPLERHWGTRRFVRFYLSCGVVAGIAYAIIGALFQLDPDKPIIGASGGVYAIVLACAVLFPHFRIIFLFFPVPIRFAAIIIFGGMILLVLRSLAAGEAVLAMSDVAHLGGAGAAAVWIWVLPRVRWQVGMGRAGVGRGRWQRKRQRQRQEQQEIDRILDKIRRDGIGSLSWREKRKLREATDRQRQDGSSRDELL
jgi:membrane associated rhomboid family serine protease